MTDADARLVGQLDRLIQDTTNDWELDRAAYTARGHRITSPVEPCDQCGRQVFLMLPSGATTPMWLQLGSPKDTDTLFPVVTTQRHACGDGDSWSVEAALFVESALAEWGVTA